MCLGIPGQISEIVDPDNFIARVRVGVASRDVNVMCVADELASIDELIGRWVLVHVGFAMMIIDEAEALRTLKLLEEWSELDEFSPSSASSQLAEGE